MPATATHAIFAMDVYNELPNTCLLYTSDAADE